jgi:hydrogenase/urease accessory protein HupE
LRPRCVAALAAGALTLGSDAAQAHLVNTGIGPVYDGIAHLFVSFEDLLPVIAMALLAGLNGPLAGRRALFGLPLIWLLGGWAGSGMPGAMLPVAPPTLSLLVLGILVAADFRLGPPAVTALALALGLAHGWQNGVALAAAGLPATSLFGTAGAVFVVTALVAAMVVALRRPWTRIAARVAGSWIAASGLLLLGWTLSGRA